MPVDKRRPRVATPCQRSVPETPSRRFPSPAGCLAAIVLWVLRRFQRKTTPRRRNGTEQSNGTPRRALLCGHFFLHFQTHTENKHVQKAKIPLFLFLAVVVMMAFSFARQSCCCCSAVCSFHTAAHIIFYFFPLFFAFDF